MLLCQVHTRKYLFWRSSRIDQTQWGPGALNVGTNISRVWTELSVKKSFIVYLPNNQYNMKLDCVTALFTVLRRVLFIVRTRVAKTPNIQ